MLWLGVDMGGTGTRWALRDADRTTIARGALGGGTGAPDPALRAAFVRTLRNLADALPGAPAGAVLGLTGSGLTPDTDLIAATAQALSLPETCIWVMNDMQLAGHTAFGHAQSGHLIAAGTGSVGLHKAADGQMHIIGGRGILIDDAGSGAWIGLQALKALWRRIEETGAPTGMEGLAAHLFAALGGTDWDTTLRWVYGGDRGGIAALAPAVAAAAGDGDETALALLTRAGQELARLGRVLIQRFGPAPVVAFGGVFSLHPAVTRAVQDALAPTPITFPALDFAAHAATLAQTRFANQTPFAPEDT
tara:strand:+ start:6893 stop:7810 length:918 start_codon:yes stop_codon:yes gene_type:complete